MTRITVKTLLQEASLQLQQALIENPQREARLLVALAINVSEAQIIAYPEKEVSLEQQKIAAGYIQRRCQHESCSRIAGMREFWGMPLQLAPATLEPRPDSETIIEAVVHFFSDKKHPHTVLDLGTGSGCLLLALLQEYSAAQGVGVDYVFAACQQAKDNAFRNALSARSFFITAHWANALQGQFDIIVSNPPYIKTAVIPTLQPIVRCYDPIKALDGGADGLDCYREILTQAPVLLTDTGKLFLELGIEQQQQVLSIAQQQGLEMVVSFPDLAGIPRCLVLEKKLV